MSELSDWMLVLREPTGEMIDAAKAALGQWRKTLSPDEALLRRSTPTLNGRTWLASATPDEKYAIRYRAMIAAAPSRPEQVEQEPIGCPIPGACACPGPMSPNQRASIICDFMGWTEDGAAWKDAHKLAALLVAPPSIGETKT